VGAGKLDNLTATALPCIKSRLASPHIRKASADRQCEVQFIPDEMHGFAPHNASGRLFQKDRQLTHMRRLLTAHIFTTCINIKADISSRISTLPARVFPFARKLALPTVAPDRSAVPVFPVRQT
jgi:hypothetical protein